MILNKIYFRSACETTEQQLNISLENCKKENNQLKYSESNSIIMKAEITEISQELEKLKVENDNLHVKNSDMKTNIINLKNENMGLRKLSFSYFHHNFINNLIESMKNMKEIYELNSKEMMKIKDEQEKLKVENDNLHAKNSDMKTNIINLKNENMGLKDQNIYLIDSRIDQNTKFENVQRKQKSFLLNLKDISQSEQNKNILLQ